MAHEVQFPVPVEVAFEMKDVAKYMVGSEDSTFYWGRGYYNTMTKVAKMLTVDANGTVLDTNYYHYGAFLAAPLPWIAGSDVLGRLSGPGYRVRNLPLGIAGSLITRPEILTRALVKGGTEEQKQHYLPRLADGREVPCFALSKKGKMSKPMHSWKYYLKIYHKSRLFYKKLPSLLPKGCNLLGCQRSFTWKQALITRIFIYPITRSCW